MTGAYLVVVIGLDREPTIGLVGDLRRLGYRAELVPWPAEGRRWRGARPVATMVDLRALGVEAGRVPRSAWADREGGPSGLAACRAARADRALGRSPVIAMVPEQEAGRLDLSIGLDDLILAPYRLSELEARLRLARRRQEQAAPKEVLRAGRLALNPVTYEVTVEGAPVDLTLKEYQLLLFLLRNANRVFERTELLDQVWGEDYYGGTRTVDVHIRRIRAKTEGAGELIETVRGVGYRLAVG